MSKLYNEINIKVALLGDGGVGKTSLVHAITEKSIPKHYLPTIGSIIDKKEYLVNNNLISAALWDIGGQRSFNPLNPIFFNNVDVAYLVFDVSNPNNTINDLRDVYLDQLFQRTAECVVFLIGNKIDLDFDIDEVRSSLKGENLDSYPLIFVSAKTMINVDDLIDFTIFSFLKECDIEFEGINTKDLALEYLKIIDKEENSLNSLIVNLEHIDELMIQKKAPIKLIQKEKEEKEEISFNKFEILQERLDDLEIMKEQIKTDFVKNLSIIEEFILNLKKTPINSLLSNIDDTLKQLDFMKDDFELKLDTILGLNSFLRSIDRFESNSNKNQIKRE